MTLFRPRTRQLEGEELWREQKRDEVWRMNPQARSEWIKAGCVPPVKFFQGEPGAELNKRPGGL